MQTLVSVGPYRLANLTCGSRFISRVLRLAVRARRDADITRRLDALFADEPLAQKQRRDADDLARLAVDWSGERW